MTDSVDPEMLAPDAIGSLTTAYDVAYMKYEVRDSVVAVVPDTDIATVDPPINSGGGGDSVTKIDMLVAEVPMSLVADTLRVYVVFRLAPVIDKVEPDMLADDCGFESKVYDVA